MGDSLSFLMVKKCSPTDLTDFADHSEISFGQSLWKGYKKQNGLKPVSSNEYR